jgi:outer membrane protein, multidrug efflux system
VIVALEQRRYGAVALAMAAAALLAGCMNFIPAYERPSAPVAATYPAQWNTGWNTGQAGPAAADLQWQRFFADPRLQRLITIALENNRDLRVAALNIEQARAAYQVRRADEIPSLGAGINAQRQAVGAAGLVTSYAVGLQVTGYELDLFGRVRSLSEVALAQYFATEAAQRNVYISLVAAVANTYASLLADDALLVVTQEALESRGDSARLTKLKFDSGVSSELDFRQAEQLLENARATLAQTQRQRALDENALTLLIGQPLPPELPQSAPLTAQLGALELPAGLPSELLERRPDVLAAEQQLLAANANILPAHRAHRQRGHRKQ